MQLLQVWAGLSAELISDDLPRPGVRGERLGRPAASLQRTHQLMPEPFPQRIRHSQPPQLGHQPGTASAAQLGLDLPLRRLQPQFLQPGRLRRRQRTPRHVGQRRSPPQAQRLRAQPGRQPRMVTGQRAATLRRQLFEPARVHLGPGDRQPVTRQLRHEHPAFGIPDQPPQPQHIPADQLTGRVRRVIAPQLTDQASGRDDLARIGQQRCGQRPPLGRTHPGPKPHPSAPAAAPAPATIHSRQSDPHDPPAHCTQTEVNHATTAIKQAPVIVITARPSSGTAGIRWLRRKEEP